jgi:hypothetical protein
VAAEVAHCGDSSSGGPVGSFGGEGAGRACPAWRWRRSPVEHPISESSRADKRLDRAEGARTWYPLSTVCAKAGYRRFGSNPSTLDSAVNGASRHEQPVAPRCVGAPVGALIRQWPAMRGNYALASYLRPWAAGLPGRAATDPGLSVQARAGLLLRLDCHRRFRRPEDLHPRQAEPKLRRSARSLVRKLDARQPPDLMPSNPGEPP